MIRKFSLLCAPILFIFGVLLWPKSDALNADLRQFAGQNATDCGVATQQTFENIVDRASIRRDAQDACAVAAFRAKKPYFVRYDEIAADREDELLSLASAMNPRGEVKFWNYQKAPAPLLHRIFAWRKWGRRSHWMASGLCLKPVIHKRKVACDGCRDTSGSCVIFTPTRDRSAPSE